MSGGRHCISRRTHIGTATVGGLITITQIGFVVGMLFLVPLGDRVEKRRLVTVLLPLLWRPTAPATARPA